MSVASRAIWGLTQRTLLPLWIALATMLACGHAAAQSAALDLAHFLPAASHAQAASVGESPAAGFANARVAVNPAAASATPVGERMCIACHQLESDHFTHTFHALGLHAANNLFGALFANYTVTALPSPALFTVQTLDPVYGLISTTIGMIVFYWIVFRKQPQPAVILE